MLGSIRKLYKMANNESLKIDLILTQQLSLKEPMCVETYPELMDAVQEMITLMELIYEAGLRKGKLGDNHEDTQLHCDDSPINSSA